MVFTKAEVLLTRWNGVFLVSFKVAQYHGGQPCSNLVTKLHTEPTSCKHSSSASLVSGVTRFLRMQVPDRVVASAGISFERGT